MHYLKPRIERSFTVKSRKLAEQIADVVIDCGDAKTAIVNMLLGEPTNHEVVMSFMEPSEDVFDAMKSERILCADDDCEAELGHDPEDTKTHCHRCRPTRSEDDYAGWEVG
jgi:hypothetical protein